MRVTLHAYATDPALPQRDGVNLAHENITRLMQQANQDRREVVFHDFNRLLTEPDYARSVLADADCVISNIGPHAHYYFQLREKLGLDFRIIRDVRTAIWSSYLFQEHLCAPFLRSEDVLMVSSHYTRAVYEKIFPHLTRYPTFRCYPLTVQFPALAPTRPRPRDPGAPVVIGYLGRLSEDKNFPDLVRLLIELNRQRAGGFRLMACGDIHSPSCEPAAISADLAAALGPGEWFTHLPARAHDDIWPVLGQFDVMLFPSTSNLETFGRVLIEASYAGVPVICSAHAAAPELMPASALCEVAYRRGEWLSAHYDHNMGRTSIARMAEILLAGALERPAAHLDYIGHPEKFLRVLGMSGKSIAALDSLRLHPAQRRLVEALMVSLPANRDKLAASKLIDTMAEWFIGLQQKNSAVRENLLKELLAITSHPQRTARYIEKSAETSCDFTNIGGIDIELCNVADFQPSFMLK